MGKKKDKEAINVKDIKSITVDFELRVPKEAFDDLLKKMVNLPKEIELPKEQGNSKDINEGK